MCLGGTRRRQDGPHGCTVVEGGEARPGRELESSPAHLPSQSPGEQLHQPGGGGIAFRPGCPEEAPGSPSLQSALSAGTLVGGAQQGMGSETR